MPAPRKPAAARSRAQAKASPAFVADDERPPAMLDGITTPRAGTTLAYGPMDTSLAAVIWRQEQNEQHTGIAFDPVTMQRVVDRPTGRGNYSKQLRPVEMDPDINKRIDKAGAEGKDYFHPDAGWMRGGVKRETDADAKREDNVFHDEGG